MDKYNDGQYISLSQKARHAIMADISQRPDIEACGVLLGFIDEFENWQVEDAYPLPNMFNSPVYFEFAPEDLVLADLTYPGQIVGVYHSHPTGFARASDTDRQNMQRVNGDERIPWAWLIICGPFNQNSLQQPLPATKFIAYHHFDSDGLHMLRLHLSASLHDAPSDT